MIKNNKRQGIFHFIPKHYYEQWSPLDKDINIYNFREDENMSNYDIDTLTSFNIEKMHPISENFDKNFHLLLEEFEEITKPIEDELEMLIKRYKNVINLVKFKDGIPSVDFTPKLIKKGTNEYKDCINIFTIFYLRENGIRNMTSVIKDEHDGKKRTLFSNPASVLIQMLGVASYINNDEFKNKVMNMIIEFNRDNPRKAKRDIPDSELIELFISIGNLSSGILSSFKGMDL